MADYAAGLKFLKTVGCCTVGNGVLFLKKEDADRFAAAHNKDVEEVAGIVPPAYLAKNRAGDANNDDALKDVIKKAMAAAGLGGD